MRICTGNGKNLEFCDEHAPTEAQALEWYGQGFDPDYGENRFAYDPEHPDYLEQGMGPHEPRADYLRCHICSKVLVYPRSSGLMAVLYPPADDEAIASS